jgi:hypothetical protein
MVDTPVGSVVVEVEGFTMSAEDLKLTEELTQRHHKILLGLLGRDRLNDAFKRARRQLARPEYEDVPKLLVVGQHPYIDTGSLAMQAIMYGDPYIQILVGPEGPVTEPESRFPMRGRLRHAGGPLSAVAVLDQVCPDETAFAQLVHHELKRLEREEGPINKKAGVVCYVELWERLKTEHPEVDLEKRVPRLDVYENIKAGFLLPRTVFWGLHDRRWGVMGAEYRELKRATEASA